MPQPLPSSLTDASRLGEAASSVLQDRRELPGHRLEGLLFRLFRTNAPTTRRSFGNLLAIASSESFHCDALLANKELFPQILFPISQLGCRKENLNVFYQYYAAMRPCQYLQINDMIIQCQKYITPSREKKRN